MQSTLSELTEKRSIPTGSAATVTKTLALDAPGVAKKIAERVLSEIDSYCVQTYDGGHRKHLGASLIGRQCKRFLWYVFRWCKHVPTTGRQQRLFNRGHREEARFIEWLEGIGFKIWFEDYESDPLYYREYDDTYLFLSQIEGDDKAATIAAYGLIECGSNKKHIGRAKLQGLEFKQYRISDCGGHFGGSLDGIAEFPPGWGIDEPVLLEFKTHGTGHKFNALKDNGIAREKEEHYAQTSTYGYKYKFRFVLYLSINKNDDDLHVELATLSHNTGEQMIAKAAGIIGSQQPPAKLSESPTYQACRYCDLKDVCHEGAGIERNCRSCEHASPVDGGQWWCALHSPEANAPIPADVIPVACPSYKAIA